MKLLNYIKYSIMTLLAAVVLAGCSDDDADGQIKSDRWIKDVGVSSILSMYDGQTVTIQGCGFEQNDKLVFVDDDAKEIALPLVGVTPKSASFVATSELKTQSYTLWIQRAEKRQELARFIVRKTIDAQVPDGPAGTNIKGMVYCGDQPMAGVLVSDGVEVVETNNDGCYWMTSAKEHGYVFVIIPKGYETNTINAMPDFWAALTMGVGYCEQHNFELMQVDNTNHAVMITTDIHLANRNQDLAQSAVAYDDMVKYSASLGKKIYSLCLGDMSWDAYWYDKQFALPQYKERIKDFPMPVFHTIGNHDYDPAYKGDVQTALKYKKEIGPTFYSFNLGNIHYVVLDNIVYKNAGNPDGNVGVVGDREYDRYVSADQIEWLKKDLEKVDAATPVVVAMHAPIYYITSAFKVSSAIGDTKANELKNCFTKFNEVHYVTGHTHRNYNVEVEGTNIYEHNVAALCATWWWTGAMGNQSICKDGAYGGYGVIDVAGNNTEWYYKSVGQPKSMQFRAYDMNKVKEHFATNSSAKAFLAAYPSRESYKNFAANSVLINIWNYDSATKIEVTEEGSAQPLTVTRVATEDPLHTLSYDIPRWVAAKTITADFASNRTTNMFTVTASDATKVITVKVTDRYGNVSTETMRRPKLFNVTMQ